MAETAGPVAAQEYRERNPQTKPQKPRGELPIKTRREIFAGRMQHKLNELNAKVGPCSKASAEDQQAYRLWVLEFREQCRG